MTLVQVCIADKGNCVILIADRLKFSINDIHLLYSRKYDNDNTKVLHLYNLVQEQKVQ